MSIHFYNIVNTFTSKIAKTVYTVTTRYSPSPSLTPAIGPFMLSRIFLTSVVALLGILAAAQTDNYALETANSLAGQINGAAKFQVYDAPAPPVLTDVHFIKLALTDSSGNLLSDNFYWRGTTNLVYTGFSTMPSATVRASPPFSCSSHFKHTKNP
jgi:hypothetical protein